MGLNPAELVFLLVKKKKKVNLVTEQKGIEGKIGEEGQGKRVILLPGQEEGPTHTAGKEEPTYQGDQQA